MPGLHNNTSNTLNNTVEVNECDVGPEPRESFLFRSTATFGIMLISLTGNALVCRGATRRRPRPIIYYLVTNLAVAELIFTATQPFHYVYNTKPYSWVFGDFMCHIMEPLTLCTTLVITSTLAAIAVYRCVVMLQPFRYRPSVRVAYIVITLSWIWGIILAMPDSITRRKIRNEDCNIFFCQNPVDLSGYRMAIFVLNFVVPFTIMLLSYSVVICKVKKHIVKTRLEAIDPGKNGARSNKTNSDRNPQPQTKDTGTRRINGNVLPTLVLNESPDAKKDEPSNKMMRLEKDVLNMIYLILLVFFVCYLPSNTLYILKEVFALEAVGNFSHYWMMVWYLNLLHTLPSALHPICYGATSRLLGQPFLRCSYAYSCCKKRVIY